MRAISDPTYMEFVARLRAARKLKGCSQSELADTLRKPQSYVSKIETSERRIDVIEAARWCAALGTSLDQVLPPTLTEITEISKIKKIND